MNPYRTEGIFSNASRHSADACARNRFFSPIQRCISRSRCIFSAHHLLLLFQQYSEFLQDFAVPDNFESLPAACPAPAAFRSHQTFPSDPSHNTGSRLSLFFLVRTAQSHHNGRAFPLSCLPALQIAPRLNTPVFPFLTPFPEYVLSEFFPVFHLFCT